MPKDSPPIKGVLFDVDGTLYHQGPLRIIMILVLLGTFFINPKQTLRKIRVINAYREAQEKMREKSLKVRECASEQLVLAARNSKESLDYVSSVVNDWFYRRPMPFLRFCKRAGLKTTISGLAEKGVKLGVFSDYPAGDKLDALEILEFFPIILSNDDPEVIGLKPFSNGFQIAAQRMGLNTTEILYIGDRPLVDGFGAAKAKMKPVIIRVLLSKKSKCDYPTIKSLSEIMEWIK